jgi:formate dehydrogenase major subunit
VVDPHGVLAAIDKLLAEKPEKVGHDFSEATRRLTAWREDFITRWRATGNDEDRRRVGQINAAISVIVGGQFPLGSVPWEEIGKAREMLGALV